ncbi:MAG: hypothetical protein PVF17_00820 [Ignavibacteria bacterium]|jgi:hypothetical protein
MRVFSVEEHEENLKNMKWYNKRLYKDFEYIKSRIKKFEKIIESLEYQISEAKAEGKIKFDSDRYRVKRKGLKEKLIKKNER